MKNTKKGVLQLLLVVVVIAALSFVSIVGVGSQHKGSAENIKLGLDLAGGVSITYEATKSDPTATEMADTISKIQKRVDAYNPEGEVYQEGSNRINVDIPDVADANEVLEALGKPAKVEFRAPNGDVLLDGSHIADAQAAQYTNSLGRTEYVVSLTFSAEGAQLFADATAKYQGQKIGIYYDDKLQSNPTVQAVISDGKAQVEGQASFQEAENLASTIRIGALPLELKEIRSNVVGAKLGSQALESSLLAGLIGFILVLLFMIVVYRVPGVAASIALIIYLLLMLIGLNGMNIALSLPGVAGIILSIGMAVDANVIIFTRIKEELSKGKTVRSAIKIGFNKAMSAIIDGNVTTLIAAAVLYFAGSGTIKGFAQTLALGIILSMLTALFVTKYLVYAFYYLGVDDVKYYGTAKEMKVRNYTGNFKKFAAISGAIILIGFAFMGYNKGTGKDILNFGLDFKGGTSTTITMNEETTSDLKAKIENSVKDVVGEMPSINEVKDTNSYVIKTKELDQETRASLEDMFVKDYGVDKSTIEVVSISSSVSNEMKTDAVVAVVIATICMLIYIWIRFKDIQFGSSAVIALVHDVLIVLTVYAVARLSVGNSFIACMLTIVGYSINATIVIFDRIRENKQSVKNIEKLEEIVNTSISQTFTRSINTSLTTFIMVFVLYIFGVDTLKDFALPLMAGIICGAYSSICITGTLWFAMKKKFSK